MPLIEENTQDILTQLRDKFMEFNKDHDEILEYYNSLPTITRQEYDAISSNK